MTTHMTTCSIRLAIVHQHHPIKRSGYQRFNPGPCKAAYSPRLHQLRRYFATTDLSGMAPAAFEAGVERMKVDFGMEQDRGRRFALWTLMHMFGAAPDLDVAFKDEADRNAARDFMEMMERANQ